MTTSSSMLSESRPRVRTARAGPRVYGTTSRARYVQHHQPPPLRAHLRQNEEVFKGFILTHAQCGHGHIDYWNTERLHNTNENFGEPRKINGTTFHGLEMTVPLIKWSPVEDEKSCVTTAIKKASCGVDLTFTNGTCYRKPGTLLAPITIPGEV